MKSLPTISKFSCIVFALLSCAGYLSSAQAQVSHLPTLQAPTSSALLKEAEAEYQRYATYAGNYFKFDAAKQAWPCEVSQAQLHELTGTVNSVDSQAAAKPHGEKSSSTPSAATPKFGYAYEDVVFHPVIAACKNGKLDGNIEFVYEGRRKAWGPTYQGSSHELAKMTMRMAEGRPLHMLELKKSTDDAQTSNSQADSKKSVGPSRGVSIRATAEQYEQGDVSNAIIVMTDKPNPMYFFNRPVANNRVEKAFYVGTTLMSVETRDEAGRSDGLSIAYKDGNAVKTCFEHGRQIDLKGCER